MGTLLDRILAFLSNPFLGALIAAAGTIAGIVALVRRNHKFRTKLIIWKQKLIRKRPHNLPDRRKFIGHVQLLEEVEDVIISYHPNIVAFDGFGGIGKTYLALEIAHRLNERKKFNAFFWSSASEANFPFSVKHDGPILKSLDDLLSVIAQVLDVSKVINDIPQKTERVNLISEALRIEKDYFLILDNIESLPDNVFQEIAEFIYKKIKSPAKVLMTGRHIKAEAFIRRNLPPMNFEEARQLLNLHSENRGVKLTQDEENFLLEEAGGIPFLIVYCIWESSTKTISIKNALQRITSDPILLGFLFKNSVERLQPISLEVFRTLLAFPGGANLDAISKIAQINNRNELDIAVGNILSQNLATSNEQDRITTSPITRAYLANLLTEKERDDLYQRVSEYYFRFADRAYRSDNWDSLYMERHNITNVMEWCFGHIHKTDGFRKSEQLDKAIRLTKFMYPPLRNKGRFDDLIQFGKKSLEAIEMLRGERYDYQRQKGNPLVAFFQINCLGQSYLIQGKYDDAKAWLNKGLSASETRPRYSDGIMLSRHLLTCVSLEQQDFIGAKEQIIAANKLLNQYGDLINDWEPFFNYDSGLLAYYQGDFDTAYYHFDELREKFDLQLGKHIPNVLTYLGNIARNRGEWQKAKKFYEDELDMLSKHYVIDYLAKAKLEFADLQEKMGNFEHAKKLTQEASQLYAQMGCLEKANKLLETT